MCSQCSRLLFHSNSACLKNTAYVCFLMSSILCVDQLSIRSWIDFRSFLQQSSRNHWVCCVIHWKDSFSVVYTFLSKFVIQANPHVRNGCWRDPPRITRMNYSWGGNVHQNTENRNLFSNLQFFPPYAQMNVDKYLLLEKNEDDVFNYYQK